MPKQTKPDDESTPEQPVSEKRGEREAWPEEQKKHDYYYDDAHGYERYDPDAETESTSEDDKTPPSEGFL